MAITPNYSWPTPDDTDLASDGALAMRNLGDDIDGQVFAIDGRVTTLEGKSVTPAGWISGQYYGPDVTISAGASMTTNQILYSPIYVDGSMSVNALAIKATAYTSTGTVLLGVYSNVNNAPSAKLFETSVSVTSANIFEAAVTQTLAPGHYWLAGCRTTGTFSCTSTSAASTGSVRLPTVMTAGTIVEYSGFVETGTGTLPATATPGLNAANRAPAVFLKKA